MTALSRSCRRWRKRKRLNAEPHGASLYLPMEGLSGYRQAIAPLLFGAEHTALKQNRIASIQTVGGSGALKVGADFLKRYFPESHVWVSDPTGKTTSPF